MPSTCVYPRQKTRQWQTSDRNDTIRWTHLYQLSPETAIDLRNVGIYVKMSPHSGASHRPHQSGNGSIRRKWPVVPPPDRPGDSGIAVGITTVDEIAIVQRFGRFERYFRRLRPEKQLLRPVHPQTVWHPPLADHLHLRGVPERIIRSASFERGPVIVGRAWVSSMISSAFCDPNPATPRTDHSQDCATRN